MFLPSEKNGPLFFWSERRRYFTGKYISKCISLSDSRMHHKNTESFCNLCNIFCQITSIREIHLGNGIHENKVFNPKMYVSEGREK